MTRYVASAIAGADAGHPTESAITANRIGVIVGAGFSAAAGWPDTSTILDRGASLVSGAQAARYRRVWEAYAAWRAASSESSGDEFMAAVRDRDIPGIDWPSVVEVVAGTIASGGAALSPSVSPRYADSLMRPNHFAAHRGLLAEATAAGDLVGVVSLNYDLLLEKTLRPREMHQPPTPGFHYGGLPKPQICEGRSSSPFARDRAVEPLKLVGQVPVWKPHGSLNWHRVDLDWDRTRSHIIIYPDLRAAFRGRGEAAIVAPVAAEETVPAWLHSVWQGAADLLASTDEWLVAGYSLPPADVALARLLAEATSRGNVRRIRVRNRTDRTRSRWEAVAGRAIVSFGMPL